MIVWWIHCQFSKQ